MCQVNGGGSFSAQLALQNPWTDSPEFFKFDYVALRSDTQNMVAAENAVWGGHMSEVVPSRTFFSFFWLLQRVHSLHWISAQCTQKRVLVVGVFLWGQIFAQWSNLPFLPSPKNIFQMGAIFFTGVNMKRPLCIMVVPYKLRTGIGNMVMKKPNI